MVGSEGRARGAQRAVRSMLPPADIACRQTLGSCAGGAAEEGAACAELTLGGAEAETWLAYVILGGVELAGG